MLLQGQSYAGIIKPPDWFPKPECHNARMQLCDGSVLVESGSETFRELAHPNVPIWFLALAMRQAVSRRKTPLFEFQDRL